MCSLYLAWLAVHHFWTFPCSQLCEEPHPKTGGNLELRKWNQKQLPAAPCDSSSRLVSSCGRQGRILFSSFDSTSCPLPHTSSGQIDLAYERRRFLRGAVSSLASLPPYLGPPQMWLGRHFDGEGELMWQGRGGWWGGIFGIDQERTNSSICCWNIPWKDLENPLLKGKGKNDCRWCDELSGCHCPQYDLKTQHKFS